MDNFSHHVKYWLMEAGHDLFFIVSPEKGPSEKIGAVKHILLAYSEPLRVLLKTDAAGDKKDIHLNGVDPQTFKNFLKCIYGAAETVVPSLSFEEAAKLLYLVEKYSINDLKPKVVSHLTGLMSPDNIFTALSHPACFQAGDLTKEIKEIFRKDIDKILSDERFLGLSDITIMWIIQQELMNVQDMKIWSAVLKWSRNQVVSSRGKTIRPQIFDILKNVHSSTMEITEFSQSVYQIDAGVLLKEKAMESYRSFSRPPNIKKECKHECSQHIATCNKVSSGFLVSSDDAIIISSIKIKEVGEDNEYTDWFECFGYSWRIIVCRKKEAYSDNLGCYLNCKSNTNTTWSCKVSFEFTLLNQHSGSSYSHSDIVSEFNEKGRAWGNDQFYSWHSLTYYSNGNGFVKNDCILLMVRFSLNK